MKLRSLQMIVGTNNAGKSNVLSALRLFYDDIKWTADDVPKVAPPDGTTAASIYFGVDAQSRPLGASARESLRCSCAQATKAFN